MSDPIEDLGKAAEAYIDATAEAGKDPGAAFREVHAFDIRPFSESSDVPDDGAS